MSRIEWVVLSRLASRIGTTLIVLVEGLNTWRFDQLAKVGGPMLGLSAIVLNAALWSLSTLPVALLVGAILGMLDLQQRRELTVIFAVGTSVWRVLRAPLIAVVILGAALALAGDTAIVTLMRPINVALPQQNQNTGLWLEQKGDGLDYVISARHSQAGGTVLETAIFFLPAAIGGPRIETGRAELVDGAWQIAEGTRFRPEARAEPVRDLRGPTTTTRGDLGARLVSPVEMTLFDIVDLMALEISDPQLRSGVQMRLAKLVALPLALAASLLIAFAFTSGYRRTNKYGGTVLYGIVLGFVVYVVTEMAASAGSAGILQPAFAAFVPALVAIFVGTTVLLFREDGQR